ncbi:MAG: threonine--tRNA ligase, partial [Candidatus Woesearchaeota archaeon]
MDEINIILDGKTTTYRSGITAKEISGKDKSILVARFKGELIDLSASLSESGELEFITFDSDEGKEIFRHSSSHILAQAVVELFP